MPRKLLIANRGEIACRVIRTARRMGITTVAVFSDADAGALHVEMADEAVHIGASPVAQSYLQGQRILDAARATGADAIHPGYGFLSESPAFVETVEAAGLVFVGPPSSAIRAMGLKDAAKALMQKAGVPVVPGYHGESQDDGLLAAEARRIGYPVLIKARAGGGGKGMRRVDEAKDFAGALESARREARSSFGDASVLIERWVTGPRHIEIQVFGDSHGDAVHLFERDCSLQRRHQKVIEEAPAPGMTAEMRAAMGEAAVKAAKAVGYVGAGTVEFIVDASEGLRPDRFWFMEMNTRLQVEHPVTEAITGLDLVEWQLRVADGEPLPLAQDDLAIRGWAFEARLYAEDVAKGFLPATGRLAHVDLPQDLARIDTGVRQGDEITAFYDPMIAKLIVHGASRNAALDRLAAALAACRIAGTVTNVGFLARLARHKGFARGEVDTGLIERDLASLAPAPEPPREAMALAALASLGLIEPSPGEDPWTSLQGWRLWSAAEQFCLLEHAGRRIEVRVTARDGSAFDVDDGQGALPLQLRRGADDVLRLVVGGHVQQARIVTAADLVTVFLAGEAFAFVLPDHLALEDEGDFGGDKLVAPMPGLVTSVSTKAGAVVAKGDALIVMEAMKMEHTLKAPRDGVVAELLVGAGDQVEDGAVLLTLEPVDG